MSPLIALPPTHHRLLIALVLCSPIICSFEAVFASLSITLTVIPNQLLQYHKRLKNDFLISEMPMQYQLVFYLSS